MSSDDKKRYLILKDPNIIKGLLILAIPLMINNFIRTFHDLVDTYWVSKIPNYTSEAISSIGVTFPITFTFISFGMGLSIAGTALISQYYGNGQLETARKYATHLIVLAIMIGVFLNIVSYFGAPYIMQLMGATGYTYENAVAYLQIRSFELTAIFILFAFTSIRQSSGDTVIPVIIGSAALIINIFLSPVLISEQIVLFGNDITIFNQVIYLKEITIQGLNLGVSGAAYATLFANVIMIPISFAVMLFSKTGITISKKYIKLEKVVSKDLITTAIPAATGQAITAIGFAVLNGFILSYGENTVAAFNVGNRISSLILMPVMAIGGIMAAFIGQNIGNLNSERAKKAFLQGTLLSVVIMIFGSIIGIIYREQVAGIFLSENAFALDLATTYMLYLFIGLPLMALFQSYIGAYNGTGNTIYTFITSVTRLWGIRIPLIIIFKNFTDLGSSGIWYAMLGSNLLISIFGIYFIKKIDFKPKINLDPVLE